MYEWNELVQLMIDDVERQITSAPSLMELSKALGYSPYYCTKQFRSITGMTLREYVWLRRISRAALELRDTDERIIDVAVKYGFSSQEAFTRAFVKAFKLTPYAYRKLPRPIPLAVRREVFSPYHYFVKERGNMSKEHLHQAEVRIEVIPAHKFIGVWDLNSHNYMNFWENGHDCDEICGVLESMSDQTLTGQLAQTAGWFYEQGNKGYFYGIPVPADYSGAIPDGMECRDIPEAEYLAFYHPPYRFREDNGAVMEIVEDKAWTFDPGTLGYQWDETDSGKQDYQKHYPEGYGYAVLRPVKKL